MAVPRWRLRPVLSSRLGHLLDQRALLHEIVRSCGSPVGVVVPAGLVENVSAFRAVFQQHGIDSDIWYACKVNKSDGFVEAAAAARIGVDVSSLWELRDALGHGIRGADIGVSGPIKNDRLLLLAAQHECTIGIDDVSELRAVAELARRAFTPRVSILVRLSGFALTTRGRSEPASKAVPENGRFGIPLANVADLFCALADKAVRDYVDLRGFSFHIDNLIAEDRVTAFGRVLNVLLEARARGFDCNRIDIGGGIPVQYVRAEDWRAFHSAYAQALFASTPFMFRDKPFGVEISDGRAVNRGNFYFHDTPLYGAGFLAAVLSKTPPTHDAPVAELVRRHGIRLTVEPGRATLDQSGLTLCRLRGVRQSTRGDHIVVCEMNMSNLWEQAAGSEYTVDPVLLPVDSGIPEKVFVAHLGGTLCLESDMLAWRPIVFPRIPREGDLLAFINTAGYQMDFMESPTHRIPLPVKVAAYQDDRGRWLWKLDTEFSQLDLAWSNVEVRAPGRQAIVGGLRT